LGIVNSSTNAPTVNVHGQMAFTNSSSSGNANFKFDPSSGTILFFLNNSTAANAQFAVGGNPAVSNGSAVAFSNNSNAGNAIINVSIAANQNNRGSVQISGTSSAANATINNVGGVVGFISSALDSPGTVTAGNAHITNSGMIVSGSSGSGPEYGITAFGTAGSNGPNNIVLGATAANASITNNNFGVTAFAESPTAVGVVTAGNAQIVNNPGGALLFGQAAAHTQLQFNSLSPGQIPTAGPVFLTDTATAGTATITNNRGNTYFTDATTAGNSKITNLNGGSTQFFDSSTAGNARIGVGGSSANVIQSTLTFNNNSNAGNAVITTSIAANENDLGAVTFKDTSSAGHATINNIGGGVAFVTGPTVGIVTAGNAIITNSGVTVSGLFGTGPAFGTTSFFAASGTQTSLATATAENAVITNNNLGGTGFAAVNSSGTVTPAIATAGNAQITNNAGGILLFGEASAHASLQTIDQGSVSTLVGPADPRDTATAANATIINNGGNTYFTDATTAANSTITSSGGGSTQFYDFSTAGSSTITTNTGSSVSFFNTSTGGNARFITNVGGTFDMSGLSSAGITAGSIEGAGNYFLGSKQLTVGGNNLSTTVSGVISDGGASGGTGGSLVKVGTGTLTLSGHDTYTGATMISAGTLQLGNGGSSGSIIGNIADNGVLAFNRSDAVTFGGIISGTGAVNQVGTGATNLTAINTYTGPTTVNGGILSVNGSIASSSLTTVNAGGTLGGNGTVGNTVINGGTLAPGNSIGLLTVQGNLVFTAAASYMVEVSPANADRTNVTGTATLGGATVNASFAAGTYVVKQYTIVNATGGVIGTFNGPVNTNLPGGFQSSLSYDANNAYLNLTIFTGPNFATGLNVNQQNVATTLTNFFNTTGGIPMVFGALSPRGLTVVSGELPTASQQATFDAMGMFLGLLTDPFVAGRGDPVSAGASVPQFAEGDASAYAANGKARSNSERDAYAAIYRKAPIMADPFTQRWSTWAAGYGGSQNTDGNTVLGSNNTRSSIGGVAVGADYRFSPNTLAGFAVAGGGTSFSVNGLGSGRSDLFQAGAFVRHTNGPAYITAALAYGWQDITTDRTVTIAGTDVLHANFNANAYSGRLEGGYRFVTPWLGGIGITPYAAGQFTTFDLPAYAEQVLAGGGTFALSYMAKSVTDTRSELGIRSDKSFAMQNGIFTLRGRAAWAHDFDPDRNIGATFQTLPGASFVVNGATHAADSALVTGSAEMKWLNGFSLAGTFEGEFSNVTRSYAGKGVVRYSW